MNKFFSIIAVVAAFAISAIVAAPSARAEDTYDRTTITNVAGTVDYPFTNRENSAFSTFVADSIMLGFSANTGTTFALDYQCGSLWVSNAVTQVGTPPRLLNLTNLPPFFIGDKIRFRSSDTNATPSKLNYRKRP